MLRSSATWRRLALDIRLHNQTMVAHPYRPTFGAGTVIAGITFTGAFCYIEPVIGFISGMAFSIVTLAFAKNPAREDAPASVVAWRDAHKIEPDAAIPELPEHIPQRLLPAKDDYEALLLAARAGDIDE